jgi:hypothetical protein
MIGQGLPSDQTAPGTRWLSAMTASKALSIHSQSDSEMTIFCRDHGLAGLTDFVAAAAGTGAGGLSIFGAR